MVILEEVMQRFYRKAKIEESLSRSAISGLSTGVGDGGRIAREIVVSGIRMNCRTKSSILPFVVILSGLTRQYASVEAPRLGLRKPSSAKDGGPRCCGALTALELTTPATLLSRDMLIPIICPTCRHIGAVSAARLPRKLVCSACNAIHIFDLPPPASRDPPPRDAGVLSSQGSVLKQGYFRSFGATELEWSSTDYATTGKQKTAVNLGASARSAVRPGQRQQAH